MPVLQRRISRGSVLPWRRHETVGKRTRGQQRPQDGVRQQVNRPAEEPYNGGNPRQPFDEIPAKLVRLILRNPIGEQVP